MSASAVAPLADDEPLPVVLALVRSNTARLLVERTVRGFAHPEYCLRLSEAEERIARALPAAFVTQRRDANGASVDELVRSLYATAPRLPVFVLSSVQPAAELKRELRTALAAQWARLRRVATALRCAAWAPDMARDAIRCAIEHGHRPMGVPALAAAIGRPRKTLDRHLSTGSPLSARELIVWGRLVSIAIALDDPRVTVAAVAADLQFSSPSALRNLLQRYTGLTPTGLRVAGGLAEITARIRSLLRATRRP